MRIDSVLSPNGLGHQHQHDEDGVRGHRAPDVRDADGEPAAPVDVAEPERDRDGEGAGDPQRRRGDADVLEQPLRDPVRALPVLPGPGTRRRRRPPSPSAPLPRRQGMSTRWTPSSRRSSTRASTTHSTEAVSTCALKLLFRPVLMRSPRPPLPTMVPIVVSATVETVAIRRPPMSTGRASGSSTRHSSPSRRVPHAAPGVADLLGHAVEPGEHRPDEDREAVQDEPDDDRRLRRPGERQQQREQRQRRDRVDRGRDAEDGRPAAADPAGHERQRQGEQRADDDGDQRDPQVLDGGRHELGGAGPDVLRADPRVAQQAVVGNGGRMAVDQRAPDHPSDHGAEPTGEDDDPARRAGQDATPTARSRSTTSASTCRPRRDGHARRAVRLAGSPRRCG